MTIKKDKLCVFIVVSIILSFFACLHLIDHGWPRKRNESHMFPDPYFEEAIRTAIDIPEGPITLEDCKGITELDMDGRSYYKSIDGIEYFVDLEIFSSRVGNIEDIGNLRSLQNLKSLTLTNNNIEDISALSELTELTFIDLGGNKIKEVSHLKGMKNLRTLYIEKNS